MTKEIGSVCSITNWPGDPRPFATRRASSDHSPPWGYLPRYFGLGCRGDCQ